MTQFGGHDEETKTMAKQIKETQQKTKNNGKQGVFSGSTWMAAAILETTWPSLSMCRQSNLCKALKSDN